MLARLDCPMQTTNNHPIFNQLDLKNVEDSGLSVEILEREVQEVLSMLFTITSDLPTPLGDLVRAQIRHAKPYLCGAVVLVVSKPPLEVHKDEAHEDSDFHKKRILLASALEMLHVALTIHRLLVRAARPDKDPEKDPEKDTEKDAQEIGGETELDRAFIGSTILAGDYCFSRAAQMAAQTDNPVVVATFSHALQLVSEGLLREQFAPPSEHMHYDETTQLMQSGVLAAAQLANYPEEEAQGAIFQSRELAGHWIRYQQGTSSKHNHIITSSSTEAMPANWQILYQWLTSQRPNE